MFAENDNNDVADESDSDGYLFEVWDLLHFNVNYMTMIYLPTIDCVLLYLGLKLFECWRKRDWEKPWSLLP